MAKQTGTQSYWEAFYARVSKDAVPQEPSLFAQWVAPMIPSGAVVSEFGFGNGRDSNFLLRQGLKLHGFDFALSAVESASRTMPDGIFRQMDVSDKSALAKANEDFNTIVDPISPRAVYARFFLHSIGPEARRNFWWFCAQFLGAGGNACVEFRTDRDALSKHVFGDDHYRSFPSCDEVVRDAEDVGGKVAFRVESQGLAPFGPEDPHVARLVVSWG